MIEALSWVVVALAALDLGLRVWLRSRRARALAQLRRAQQRLAVLYVCRFLARMAQDARMRDEWRREGHPDWQIDVCLALFHATVRVAVRQREA